MTGMDRARINAEIVRKFRREAPGVQIAIRHEAGRVLVLPDTDPVRWIDMTSWVDARITSPIRPDEPRC